MNLPAYIVVHCSDSPVGDAESIDRYHREERHFDSIGYHHVVLNGCRRIKKPYCPEDDGRIEPGRPESQAGAHCEGLNHRSVGVCMIGKGGLFTEAQLTATRALVIHTMALYGIPVDHVLGHCETEDGRRQGKTCPTLDMQSFRDSLTPKESSPCAS